MDIRVIAEAIKLWAEESLKDFLAENRAVIITAVAGAIVVVVTRMFPSLEEMRPFIEEIVLGVVAAVFAVAWKAEDGRLKSLQNSIKSSSAGE